jgi:2-desacetyl-2-hydroxyethyl bacteriochlorophyllide A dehydrogenase
MIDAIRLEKPGQFSLTTVDEPSAVQEGEARVRIHRVGICGTDLHAFRGRQPFFSYPRILGHELGVEIEEIAENSAGLKVGDVCAVEPYLTCGKCIACRCGRTNCCATLQCLGVHTDGGMRQTIVVPISKLHPSAKLSLDQLALVETLGIGAHAVERARLQPQENVLVIGAGPIGLSAAQFSRIAKANVIVLDVNVDRLRFCRDNLKIEHCIVNNDRSLEAIASLTDGEMPTAVFDCTGNPQSMMSSFDMLSQGGRLILVGIVQGDLSFSDPGFHRREATLLASRNSTGNDFRRIISLIEDGVIDTTPWITHRVAYREMISEFPKWLDPASRTVKAIVEW